MDLEDCPEYEELHRRHETHTNHYCTNCNQKLYPYCIKHNDSLKEIGWRIYSCGVILCRQNFISYYSPSKGCKRCCYGETKDCHEHKCIQAEVVYPKGCEYCRHWLCNGIQVFKCETPLDKTDEQSPEMPSEESPYEDFEIDDDIKRHLIELYDELVDD